MTPHATPALAQQLRSLVASAPTLHRPALAAAADAVEECARLRDERDEALADAVRYRWLRDGERTLREWDSIRDLWESTLDAAIDAALKGDAK